MYKSNLCHKKTEKKNYPSNKGYNLLSPPYHPKERQKQYFNGNNSKYKPVNLYSTYLSPQQNEKNFSVKNITSPDDKLNQDLLNKFSNCQKNLDEKMFQSPNTTNSDLLTVASLTTQQSSESLLSNNQNTNKFIPTTFNPMINNYTVCQFPGHRYNYSMSNYPQMNYFYPNNNPFLNGNFSNMNMKYNNRQSCFMTYKQKKNNQNTVSNINNNKFKKNTYANNAKNKKNDNEDKIDVSNFNSNNSIKSGSGSEKSNSNTNISKNSSKNIDKDDSSSGKSEKKTNNSNTSGTNGVPRKKYYNKFNSPKENNVTNENTVILTLKIKVAPNDFRTFNLKKYDDLFISLEKFFDLNKIKQDLVKPIVTKIFSALNKIFWLLNNKIGIYDQEYLNSLHKLWIKNNGQIPKRSSSKEEEKQNENNNNGRNKKNKENSDKSTISSSDSSDGDKKHKKIMSNSFQNMDMSSEEGKEDTVNSI